MNSIKKILLLISIICCSCSSKLDNKLNWWMGQPEIKKYTELMFSYDKNGNSWFISKEGFHSIMELVYEKYPETHISLEILKQMEQTDTVLRLQRPSLRELQYSSKINYSKLASYDSIPVQMQRLKGYWYVYRLKSPATNNVFVLKNGYDLLCVHIASNDYSPVYLKDLNFEMKKAILKDFETNLLPILLECKKKIEDNLIWK